MLNNSYINPNTQNFTIDTGATRHIYGNALSGAVGVGIVSCITNSKKVKAQEITRTDAVRNTLKDSLIGGVATAAAVSVANNLGDPNKSIFQTLGSLVIGAGAIYAIEQGASMQNKKLIEEKVGK